MIFNRKGEGILVPNTLSIILAVIGILLIVIIGVKLYIFLGSQEQENARNVLDNIIGKAELLKDGEKNTFAIRGIKDWVLIGWSKGQIGKPEKCFTSSCLCICVKGKDCQDNGFCEKIDKDIVYASSTLLPVGRADILEIIQGIPESKRPKIEFYNKNLFGVEISKGENFLEIFIGGSTPREPETVIDDGKPVGG